jgi:hypothetical protein
MRTPPLVFNGTEFVNLDPNAPRHRADVTREKVVALLRGDFLCNRSPGNCVALKDSRLSAPVSNEKLIGNESPRDEFVHAL